MGCLRAKTGTRRPAVVWTLADAAVAYLWSFGGAMVGSFLGRTVAQDLNVAYLCGMYAGELLGLYVPIRRIRRRYGLPKGVLGLQRGKLHPVTSIILGISLAASYFLLVRACLFRFPIEIGARASYLELVFAPLYLSGFAIIVLTPLSEEVLFRGFLYARLRDLVDSRLALLAQAAVFSLVHLGPWHSYSNSLVAVDMLLIGLMLGLLYEKTDSLYPSIVCHGALNYVAMFGG
jgi:membrane protease YdiL (CAAX protease family)